MLFVQWRYRESVALHLLHHAAYILADIEFCAVGGFHGGGLDYLSIHGGYTIAFLFAAAQASQYGDNGNNGQYFLHCSMSFVGSIYSLFGHPNRQNPLFCWTTVV